MWHLLKKLIGAQNPAPQARRPHGDERAAWWSAARRPPRAGDLELAEPARRWLELTPAHARPVLLAARHPRIVNRIAALRGDAVLTLDCLDALLVDERGGRDGFVPAIRAEIVRLRYLCSARLVDSAPTNRWEQARPARAESTGGLMPTTRLTSRAELKSNRKREPATCRCRTG